MNHRLNISSPNPTIGIDLYMVKTYNRKSEFFENRIGQIEQDIARLSKSMALTGLRCGTPESRHCFYLYRHPHGQHRQPCHMPAGQGRRVET